MLSIIGFLHESFLNFQLSLALTLCAAFWVCLEFLFSFITSADIVSTERIHLFKLFYVCIIVFVLTK